MNIYRVTIPKGAGGVHQNPRTVNVNGKHVHIPEDEATNVAEDVYDVLVNAGWVDPGAKPFVEATDASAQAAPTLPISNTSESVPVSGPTIP